MKKRTRRILAIMFFAAAATLPVGLAALSAYVSGATKLSQSTAERLGDLLDMRVKIGRTRQLSPTAMTITDISVSPLGDGEEIASFREVRSRLEGEGNSRAAIEVKRGTFSLGDEDARRKMADSVGRLMRKSGVATAQCKVSEVAVQVPGLAEPLEVDEVEGLVFEADESGALTVRIGKAKGYLGDRLLSFEGELREDARGAFSFAILASRDAGGLVKPGLGKLLGGLRGQCIKDFRGLEVLSITQAGISRSIQNAELSLTLHPLYEELGLTDTYNAIRTSVGKLEIADGELTALELTIAHDVQQFGRSATSTVSSRFLRTVTHLATGESVDLPSGRDSFAFSDLEFSVTLKGDTITFDGRLSRQGQWIELADEALKGAAVTRLGVPVMSVEEFARRWQETCRRNREGWPEETTGVQPIEVPSLWDLLHRLGAERPSR
ncbi:MAG: hypothetical protein V2A58_14210 [Planctomycetota bacterium]